VSERVGVVWDDAFVSYDLGPGHPLQPVRLKLTIELARGLGVLDNPGVSIVRPVFPGGLTEDAALELIHDPGYLAAVRGAPEDIFGEFSHRYGLATDDNPVFYGMHEAASLIAAGSMAAAAEVWQGGAQHAVNISGGLHHAMRARASGFCIYNDAAIAIRWLLDHGVGRIAYVDVDAHHGDGVQAAFYDEPRVLTISLHETGFALFPGTGFPDEVGHGAAEGTAVNIALPSYTSDAGWLRAFSGVVPILVREFKPDILVTQCGCDSHRYDPLASLRLSVEGQATSYALLHRLAHEVCGGRWLAFGGGGYSVGDVVPRAWTLLLSVATGADLGPESATPDGWRELVRERTGAPGPGLLGDGVPTSGGLVPFHAWDAGAGDEDDPLDRAVAATRRAVLPLHGLDPLHDR
jgi:acetoin utilization protein AcuC